MFLLEALGRREELIMATTLPANTTKVNFDAGTDDPKAARAEFATNADIQNSLKSALGAFAQLSNPAGSGIEVVAQGGGTPDDVRVHHPHERKTATYLAAATDRSKLLEMDSVSAITLDLTAALTLGEGWFVLVHSSGAGTLTIDANGADLIDDAATITIDQGESVIIICDGVNFWTVGKPSTAASFVSGTVILFHQSAAPTGWTKDVAATLNNSALRVVTNTAWVSGKQGATAFTTVFGSGKTTGAHTLTTGEIPAHAHTTDGNKATAGTGQTLETDRDTSPETHTTRTDGGSGGSHDHTLSLDLNYINLIIASKD